MTMTAFAVPAFPDIVVFTQPCNREITVSIYLKGDERVHWAETVDGYSLLHGDDGSLVYATLDENGDMIATDLIATEKENRSPEVESFLAKTPKHLRFSQKQVDDMLEIWKIVENAKKGPKTMSNVLGEKKFLVILFEFNDKPFTHSKLEFKRLFNQVNYTTNGATGSVHDYYYDVSGGLFSLSVNVVGPYTGMYNTAHYGNSNNGYQDFANEAVEYASADVDFSDYDNDGDGYIDGLHIIFAGSGEEAGAGEDCIWSHKWNIFNEPVYNNTIVDVYSCSPECSGSAGTEMTRIGVICHELGHVFGAPDFYDTDYAGSGGEFPGLGQWDIMSSGSWNRGGISPAHHNPYTKVYIYGWRTCDTIDATPERYIMNPVENGGEIHRVNTSTNRDFFLIENRQQIKWDKGIPGHGMLVYHIHPNAIDGYVSNSRHPQQIYILAKPNNATDTFPRNEPSSYGIVNNSDTPYPSTNGRRDSLTDNSVPWFRPWSKAKNNTPIYNISENTNTKQVFFTVQQLSADPLSAIVEGVDRESVIIDWTPFGGMDVLIAMNTVADAFGVPTGTLHTGDTMDGGGVVVYRGGGNSAVVEGLQTGTTYYFKIYSINVNGGFSDGIIVEGSPIDCETDDWLSEDFDEYAIGTEPDCWNGDWSVEPIMGRNALASRVQEQKGWTMTSSKPFNAETPSDAVLRYKVHFDGDGDEDMKMVCSYRSSVSDDWAIIDTLNWHFGMSTWKEELKFLPMAGNNSKIKFSAYTGAGQRIAVDDIEVIAGALVEAKCDNNGVIEPSGRMVKEDDDTIVFTISPLSGYDMEYLTLDGRQIMASLIQKNEDGTYTYKYGTNGGSHTIYAYFERKTGIEEPDKNDLMIYPNPTNGIVNIKSDADGNAEIYDIRGRRIDTIRLYTGINQTDVSHLPKGIYVLKHLGRITKMIKN